MTKDLSKPHIQSLTAAAFPSGSPFLHLDPLIPDRFHSIISCPSQPLNLSIFFPLDTFFHRGPNTFVGSINTALVQGKSAMNGENMKMLFRHKRCLPASLSDGDNVRYTTHDVWSGILKSFMNHKCSKIMDFIIGSVRS